MIERRVATGRWVRVSAGVYRLAGVPVTWRQRALAGCLVGGPGAVMSHRSAAVLWGVSGFRPGPLEITVPASRSGRHPFARAHRSDVPSRDRTVRDRVPVSRPGRMLVDLAGVVSGAALEEAVDDVVCRRLVCLDELVGRAVGMGNRRGSRALPAVLAAWDAGASPDGVAEMRIVRQLLAAGLPAPERQHETLVGGELVARVDLAYPEWRAAMEVDGFRGHAGRSAVIAPGPTGSKPQGGGYCGPRRRTATTCAAVRRPCSGGRDDPGHYARRRA